MRLWLGCQKVAWTDEHVCARPTDYMYPWLYQVKMNARA